MILSFVLMILSLQFTRSHLSRRIPPGVKKPDLYLSLSLSYRPFRRGQSSGVVSAISDGMGARRKTLVRSEVEERRSWEDGVKEEEKGGETTNGKSPNLPKWTSFSPPLALSLSIWCCRISFLTRDFLSGSPQGSTVEYGYLHHCIFASDGFKHQNLLWTDSTVF